MNGSLAGESSKRLMQKLDAIQENDETKEIVFNSPFGQTTQK